MRIASIDIGTHTILLLIAEIREGHLQIVQQEETFVRLGEGIDRTGKLAPAAIDRAVACLKRYIRSAESLGAEKIVACGTSAMRDAENRAALIDRSQRELHLDIRVISGEEEARLSYLGAVASQTRYEEPVYMLDIGGGSTELCWGDGQRMWDRVSVNIGSVRLTERLLHHDPPCENEIAAVQETILRALTQQVSPAHPPCGTLVGVDGTVTTFAAMRQKLEQYDRKLIDGFVLSRDEIAAMTQHLARLPLSERRRIAGLAPQRAEVMLAGALILCSVMEYLHAERITASDTGLRFGLALSAAAEMRGLHFEEKLKGEDERTL